MRKISPQDYGVPGRMAPALLRYIEQGVMPGDFLRAVLENNLKEAVGNADDTNIRCLPAYVIYLYSAAPAGCWGSPEKVRAWIEKHEQAREQARVNAAGSTA